QTLALDRSPAARRLPPRVLSPAASSPRRMKDQIPQCARPAFPISSSSARSGSASGRVLPGIFLHLRADKARLPCPPPDRYSWLEATEASRRDPPDVRDRSSPALASRAFPVSLACLPHPISLPHRVRLYRRAHRRSPSCPLRPYLCLCLYLYLYLCHPLRRAPSRLRFAEPREKPCPPRAPARIRCASR